MPVGSRSVAVCGADGIIGRQLLAALAADTSLKRVTCIDPIPPDGAPASVRHRAVDLRSVGGVRALSDLIVEEDCDTLIYLGYLSARLQNQEDQLTETRVLIEALSRRPVPRLVYTSSTAVYGVLPGDPSHFEEDAPLALSAESDWVKDKVACDQLINRFALDVDTQVTVLRLAVLIGPNVQNFMTEYLGRPAVPIVQDYDPPIQLLHETDAVKAYQTAIKRSGMGVYNVVGDGALPLSVALRVGRRRTTVLPEIGRTPITQLLWDKDIVETAPVMRDLFHYVWVADGGKAGDELGFQPQYSSKESIEEFYRGSLS